MAAELSQEALGLPPPPQQQHQITSGAKTFSVVTGQIPPALLPKLHEGFSTEETERIYARVNVRVSGLARMWAAGCIAVGAGGLCLASFLPYQPALTRRPRVRGLSACRRRWRRAQTGRWRCGSLGPCGARVRSYNLWVARPCPATFPRLPPTQTSHDRALSLQSAVGKSSLMGAKVSELLGCVQNGVLIDGAEFREVHAGWQAVTAHGHEHGLLHADAWPMFKEAGRRLSRATEEKESNGFTGQMKRQLLREALRDRQHVVIPDCANHPDRLQHMIEEVRSCGYAMHALCLWAPLSATRVRGEERAVREGKLWSPKEYVKSTRGALALAMRWIDGIRDDPGAYCSLELWDNTDFPATESTQPRSEPRASRTERVASHGASRTERVARSEPRASSTERAARVETPRQSAAWPRHVVSDVPWCVRSLAVQSASRRSHA